MIEAFFSYLLILLIFLAFFLVTGFIAFYRGKEAK